MENKREVSFTLQQIGIDWYGLKFVDNFLAKPWVVHIIFILARQRVYEMIWRISWIHYSRMMTPVTEDALVEIIESSPKSVVFEAGNRLWRSHWLGPWNLRRCLRQWWAGDSEAGDRQCSFRALTLRKIGSTCGADPSQEKELWSLLFPHWNMISRGLTSSPSSPTSPTILRFSTVFLRFSPLPLLRREAGSAGLKASHGIAEGALRECQEPKMTRYGGVLKWGTPKWMVYKGKSHWNGWFGSTPISGNLHMTSWWWLIDNEYNEW